jgi:hypothetical protein
MLGTLRAVKFLFLAPFILVLLFVINWMTFDGEWWVKWAALGMGIAWVVSLFRVLRSAVLAGGLAALVTYLTKRDKTNVGA